MAPADKSAFAEGETNAALAVYNVPELGTVGNVILGVGTLELATMPAIVAILVLILEETVLPPVSVVLVYCKKLV